MTAAARQYDPFQRRGDAVLCADAADVIETCAVSDLAAHEQLAVRRQVAEVERLRAEVGRLAIGTRISWQSEMDPRRRTGTIVGRCDYGYYTDDGTFVLWKSHHVRVENDAAQKQEDPIMHMGQANTPEQDEARRHFVAAVDAARAKGAPLAAAIAAVNDAEDWREHPDRPRFTEVNYHYWRKTLCKASGRFSRRCRNGARVPAAAAADQVETNGSGKADTPPASGAPAPRLGAARAARKAAAAAYAIMESHGLDRDAAIIQAMADEGEWSRYGGPPSTEHVAARLARIEADQVETRGSGGVETSPAVGDTRFPPIAFLEQLRDAFDCWLTHYGDCAQQCLEYTEQARRLAAILEE